MGREGKEQLFVKHLLCAKELDELLIEMILNKALGFWRRCDIGRVGELRSEERRRKSLLTWVEETDLRSQPDLPLGSASF